MSASALSEHLCTCFWCMGVGVHVQPEHVMRWAQETDVEQRAITIGTGETSTRIEARGNFAEESIGLLHELGIQELAVDVAALQADLHRRQVGFNCSHGC